jgi:hypothetical protein
VKQNEKFHQQHRFGSAIEGGAYTRGSHTPRRNGGGGMPGEAVIQVDANCARRGGTPRACALWGNSWMLRFAKVLAGISAAVRLRAGS